MFHGVPPRVDPPPTYPPQAPSLKPSLALATLGVALIVLAAALAVPPGGRAYSTRNSVANISALGSTTGFEENYNLSLITLPNFAPLSAYLHNYRVQYPTVAFAGSCAGALLYIDTSSKLDCFNPYDGTVRSLSAPLTLLYQQTPGLSAQIDNEFQLDTPGSTALLYGNLTTSPGNVTVETVDLTNGSIHLVTTPVKMENGIQADYIGSGDVVIFNATGVGGLPTYFTNIYNGTSWRAGPSIGFAPNNVYWVWQLGAFVDAVGLELVEFQVVGNTLVQAGTSWFNYSGMTSVDAVDGLVYNAGSHHLAVDLSTNLGNYVEVAHFGSSKIAQSGSYGYLSTLALDLQRYSYTSSFVWSTTGAGASQLFDPFTNGTESVPNLVGRQESSGANGNFEFTNPTSTAQYVSVNSSLAGLSALSQNEFIWAWQPPSSSGTSVGAAPPGAPVLLGEPLWLWFVAALVVIAVPIAYSSRSLKA
jgi:hypothetical protein